MPVCVIVTGNRAPELAEHLLNAWDWCAVTPVDSAPVGVPVIEALLDPDDSVVAAARERGAVAGTTLLEVSGLLTPTINATAMEKAAPDLTLIHGAAVADPTSGRTVVLVGPSGTGKSTATRVLAGPEAPFAYVTDETVALGPDLVPRTFAKPLSLYPPDRDWGKEQHAPASLGLTQAPPDLSLAAVLFLERVLPEGEPPIVHPLPHYETINLLGENSSFLRLLNTPVKRLAKIVEAVGGGHLVGYHEAADLVSVVQSFIDAGPNPMTLVTEPLPALPPSPPALERWVALPRQDEVVLDQHAVVFAHGQLTSLSPLGAATLALLRDHPVSVADLEGALVAQFGEPEQQATEAVLETLHSLEAVGLVQRLPAVAAKAEG